MRLSEMQLINFRSCLDTTIEFSENVTILLGENGSGKSNIIDAIRLVTSPANGQRFYYFDSHRDLSKYAEVGSEIVCRQTFSDLTEVEKALYIPQLVDHHDHLVYTTTFSTITDLPKRYRYRTFVGDARVVDPEPENRERIACVYLPPLRDAERELDMAGGGRLSQIIRAIGTPEEIDGLLKDGNDAIGGLATNPLTERALNAVQGHLTKITEPVRHQSVHVAHREQDLDRLVRFLRLRLGEFGMDPGDITASGMGYANLLYIAVVVLELENASEFDLTLLLVEEPEAHLHPQLQHVLLSYLEARAEERAIHVNAAHEPTPAGRIQVIVTTHSPSIASAVSTANVVSVKQGLREHGANPKSTTSTMALSKNPLKHSDRRKIDRYLDVTRSTLLFARQVILTEGISESILIRTLAEQCVFRCAEDQRSLTQIYRDQFRSITIVPIDGVDFRPYLQLILGGSMPIAERVVVITDGDGGAGCQRRKDYEDEFQSSVDSGTLSIHVGQTTLEAEIFGEIANESLMRKVYLQMHPRSGSKWDDLCLQAPEENEERSKYFHQAMKRRDSSQPRIDFRKGDFAHLLAEELVKEENSISFRVPSYLYNAIRAAIIKPPHVNE